MAFRSNKSNYINALTERRFIVFVIKFCSLESLGKFCFLKTHFILHVLHIAHHATNDFNIISSKSKKV